MSRAVIILALLAVATGTPVATGQVPDVVSPLVSYQFLDSLGDPPAQPNVVSPVASYQFLDSLGDPPDRPNVVSPLVSYQYFDWLGEEHLAFEFSPVASYYFGGGTSLTLSGVVRDTNGLPVDGAEVILQRYNTVFWQGITRIDGTLPAASLPAGNFNVVVIKSGYTSLFQSVPGNAGGPVFLDLTLRPALGLPSLITVNRSPADTAIWQAEPPDPSLPRAPSFKVFSGSSFSDSAPVDPNRMTIVISHGWNKDGGAALSTWATSLAFQIMQSHALGANSPNIVGWDWSERAHTAIPPIDEACRQGEYLGQALHKMLGTGYNQRIHFIGHSLGTIVNAYACDYVHGTCPRERNNPEIRWSPSQTKPHVTILDEAELTSVLGQNVATSAALGWQSAQVKGGLFFDVPLASGAAVGSAAVAAVSDWKDPVPKSAVWTDNYISLVGVQHKNAVNVSLPSGILSFQPSSGWAGLVDAHAYAHVYYRNTIQPTGAAPMIGFNRSYERSLAAFPPTGDGLTLGSVWTEDLDTADPLDLKRDPLIELNLKLPKSLAVLAGSPIGAATVGTLGIVGEGVLDAYETSIDWAGELGGTVIYTTGQVVASVSEKIGNWWDAAWDAATSINPESLFTGSIAAPTTRLLLSTPGRESPMRSPRGPISQPQAWVPMRIPANAAFLAFDFAVTGDPVDDQIACAINEQNLFTLPARFAPDDSPVSTDFLDVSEYAGQQVELYFGLVGGTSSGCTLAIDGIRFVTMPTPKLAATVLGDQARLYWPAAAVGWTLQRNPGLAPEGWQDVALPDTVKAADGVVTLDLPRSMQMEFFRLRRTE